MSTKENLEAAFAGESQANRKYLAFAKKADQEGFPQIGKLFRAAAAAETVHAHAHFRAVGGVNSTEENLNAAIAGEDYEVTSMYPSFIEEAEKEGNKRALVTFKNAFEVEKIHRDLYTKALETFKSGSDFKDQKVFVCDVCGNTVYGEAPEKCPICGVAHDHFNEVE